MFLIRKMMALLLILTLFGCGAAVDRKNQAKSHFTLGLSHMQNGSPTLALKELLQAVKFDSSDAQIHAALAQAYQVKKAFMQAEQHYLRALKLSDDDPRYQNNLAALYVDMEQWDKALDYFGRASKNLLFMRTEVALTGIGYAHFRKGDYPAAISAYQEARAIAPGFAPISLRLGEVFAAMGQDGVARKEFEKALQQSPNYAEAHYRLGLVLLREKQLQQAAERFRQVVELSAESEWGQKSAGVLQTLP
jgi:Tfp pilus assembly protein PilF